MNNKYVVSGEMNGNTNDGMIWNQEDLDEFIEINGLQDVKLNTKLEYSSIFFEGWIKISRVN